MLEEIKQFSVPEDIANELEDFVFSGKFSLKLIPYTCLPSDIEEVYFSRKIENNGEFDGIKVKDSYYFNCKIVWYDDKQKFVNYELTPYIENLQNYLALEVIKESLEVKLVRINCSVRMFDDESITQVHTDVGQIYQKNSPDYSVIYYANDSSGDTHFFDDNKKLIKKVSPKKGTGVIFNSTILHAGQYPKNHVPRFCIYFNFARNLIGNNKY
jgi:hypothetical protein